MSLNRKLPPVRADQFSMVSRPEVPRSTFRTQHTLKSTYNAGYLYPVLVEEVLPGDVYRADATLFMRMATPLFPIMDNVHAETFFFFVPSRLVWDNWVKFMGERRNPTDSINYLVPKVASAPGGFARNSIADHFGLPTAGSGVDPAGVLEVNALPFRAYNLIWNEWFRDQNLQQSLPVNTGDGPDLASDYAIRRRNKRHDYFTSALPWPQKGPDVMIPLGTSAPVRGIGVSETDGSGWNAITPAGVVDSVGTMGGSAMDSRSLFYMNAALDGGNYTPIVWADLSSAEGASINAMRVAMSTQQLLERDARGGTRYTEVLRNHFGVTPQDSRLQRPEYIGGGGFMLQTQAIPQTAPSEETTVGALGGATTGADRHSWSYAATEHGYIIGLVNIFADITYQQGLPRLWTRETRYDFYWPSFAFLGEQAIRQDEIYATGLDTDTNAFGYQERWAEYRHRPSRITGEFRSRTTGATLDNWHLAQYFANAPQLNAEFIAQSVPVARVLAAGTTADNQQFLLDSVWNIACTRALPIRSVPGLTRF